MVNKPVRTTPEFDILVKALSKPKKYPKLPADLAIFKNRLAVGAVRNKRARGVKSAPVFGARVMDSSSAGGASGGFRVLYFDGADERVLLHIDRRRDLDDWPTGLILRMLDEWGLWPLEG